MKLSLNVHSMPTLPPVDEEGQIFSEPIAVLQSRTKSLRSRVITEVLVQWMGCPPEDATWGVFTSAVEHLSSPCGQSALNGKSNVRYL